MASGDGIFTYRHGVAAAQIGVFSIFLLVASHFKRSNRSGWLTISNFSIFRIVGASCLIALIKDPSKGLFITAFVCESQGVLLVLFLLVKILKIMCVPFASRTLWG
ncbi:hypothetical protein IMZ48_39875 [Candidatus Bathyarchaeota archaeon]|nr:hypothetical protein [Candidatus Bathyarchaeota archaeon]